MTICYSEHVDNQNYIEGDQNLYDIFQLTDIV